MPEIINLNTHKNTQIPRPNMPSEKTFKLFFFTGVRYQKHLMENQKEQKFHSIFDQVGMNNNKKVQ
jgi:hypothetical protein